MTELSRTVSRGTVSRRVAKVRLRRANEQIGGEFTCICFFENQTISPGNVCLTGSVVRLARTLPVQCEHADNKREIILMLISGSGLHRAASQ
jgi:hypothetical protein